MAACKYKYTNKIQIYIIHLQNDLSIVLNILINYILRQLQRRMRVCCLNVLRA